MGLQGFNSWLYNIINPQKSYIMDYKLIHIIQNLINLKLKFNKLKITKEDDITEDIIIDEKNKSINGYYNNIITILMNLNVVSILNQIQAIYLENKKDLEFSNLRSNIIYIINTLNRIKDIIKIKEKIVILKYIFTELLTDITSKKEIKIQKENGTEEIIIKNIIENTKLFHILLNTTTIDILKEINYVLHNIRLTSFMTDIIKDITENKQFFNKIYSDCNILKKEIPEYMKTHNKLSLIYNNYIYPLCAMFKYENLLFVLDSGKPDSIVPYIEPHVHVRYINEESLFNELKQLDININLQMCGEGEHLIIQHIVNDINSGISDNILIDSTDSDIIILLLMNPIIIKKICDDNKFNIFILTRKDIYIRNTTTLNYLSYYMLNFKEFLIKNLKVNLTDFNYTYNKTCLFSLLCLNYLKNDFIILKKNDLNMTINKIYNIIIQIEDMNFFTYDPINKNLYFNLNNFIRCFISKNNHNNNFYFRSIWFLLYYIYNCDMKQDIIINFLITNIHLYNKLSLSLLKDSKDDDKRYIPESYEIEYKKEDEEEDEEEDEIEDEEKKIGGKNTNFSLIQFYKSYQQKYNLF